ncbi:MAG: sel1 repeat family protein [Gammaproteobacteria bacterium]|nr:sel1 repeat family protein [Gammaproteobacteria bacterium]
MYLSSIKFTTIIPLAICCLILFLISDNFAHADYIDGEKANAKGDRKTAFTEFYNATQQGDGRAYGKLGSMYLYGLGTDKNYHHAFIWFHMAYLNGEREGERFRDAASSMMNREQYLTAVEAAEKERIKQHLGKTPPQTKPPI